MFFVLRTPQEREFLMNERIQVLEIPGAADSCGRLLYDSHRALGLDVLAPRSRLLEASRGKKLRSPPETFQLTGAAVPGTARSRHGE
jgi:hypothetical protein